MTVFRSAARVATPLLMLAAGSLSACKDASTPPVVVASIEVSSPLGALLDVGTQATLLARAEDRSGHLVPGAALVWSSSSPGVASIDDTGLLQALAIGDAAISAAADGASGGLTVHVVDADRAGIGVLSADAFLAAMLAATTADVRGRLQPAHAGCVDGATTGNLEQVQACVAAIRVEAAGAADPTDRALLAALLLFFDEIERLLGT